MTSSVLTIKKVPTDLKRFWADEAKRNSRSMNKELIRILEQERARREDQAPPARDLGLIDSLIQQLQNIPITDPRSTNDILYDEEGMPK